jgi:hypothetical protein
MRETARGDYRPPRRGDYEQTWFEAPQVEQSYRPPTREDHAQASFEAPQVDQRNDGEC